MHEEPRRKIELQHIIIWYGSSCTNKHDKLMGTSIQVLSSAISYSTKNEMTKNTVNPYWAGIVNHAMMNKTVKITGTMFTLACALHLQTKTDEELYVWPEKCHVRYITKKVGVCT